MAGYKEVIAAIGEVKVEIGKNTQALTDLKDRLYDGDGDIPEIKERCKEINGVVKEHTKKFASLPCRVLCKNKKLWVLIVVVLLGGGGFLSKETIVSLINLFSQS